MEYINEGIDIVDGPPVTPDDIHLELGTDIFNNRSDRGLKKSKKGSKTGSHKGKSKSKSKKEKDGQKSVRTAKSINI